MASKPVSNKYFAINCPRCEGAGRIKVIVDSNRPEERTSFRMDCTTCGGKGVVSNLVAKAYQEEIDSWCQCKDRDPDDIILKWENSCSCGIKTHHYHCRSCGRLTQIG